MTILYLVRHGETDANRQGLFQGMGGELLNARGERQAKAIGQRLQRVRLQAIYSSEAARAWHTATPIENMQGTLPPLVSAPALQEWDVGAWTGQPISAYTLHLRALGVSPALSVPEGGESWGAVQERMRQFVVLLGARHANERIALVSHGKPLDVLVAWVLGLDLARWPVLPYRVANGSLTVIEYDDSTQGCCVRTLNDTAHLEGLA